MSDNTAIAPDTDAYQRLFSNTKVPMLIISSSTGRIVNGNPAACAFYGYEVELLKKLNINDINQLSPEEVKAEIARAKNYKCNYFIFPHKLASGEVRRVEVYSHPVQLGDETYLFSIIHDITDRVRAEEKLKQAAAVYDSTSEGILISNCKGEILDANRALSDLVGCSREKLISKSCEFIFTGENEESYQLCIESAAEQGSWRGEKSLRTKDKKFLPVTVTINRVFDENENATNFVHIINDISYYKEISDKLSYLAHHDQLTSLPNRLMLFEKLEEYLSRADRNGSLVYIIFIDLDGFKAVNDNLGHAVGDALLISVAQRLQEVIRSTDTVSRFSGDEFAVVIEAAEQPYEITQTLKRLVDAFNQPFSVLGHSLEMTASIGVSTYPGDAKDANQLISYADVAMYDAKRSGRNRYSFFNAESEKEIKHRSQVESALKEALNRDEFSLYFQPQIDMRTRSCLGFEVLLRWRNSELDSVPPNIFILMAEQLGIMDELGLWVMEEACKQGMAWKRAGLNFGKLSINISGTQLKNQKLALFIERVLLDSDCDPGSLELEVVEGFIMNSSDESIALLAQIQSLGVGISIDDFGTGYSSVAHLKSLPVNSLKIDQSIISGIDKSEDGKVVVQSIIAMARAMGLDLVAEGVETSEQAEFLLTHDCAVAQGFLYEKPMSAEEAGIWLRENKNAS